MNNRIRVAMVDDHLLFRKGIEAILTASDNIDVVLSTAAGDELLNWLSTNPKKTDVVMLDIEMPGMNGIQITEQLHSRYPDLRIIILSMHFRENLIAGLVEKCVHCFLPKNSEPE